MICAITITSCKEHNITSYRDYGLNIPVKSIKVTTYEAESKFGEIVKGDREYNGHYTTIFNDEGLVISTTTYNYYGDTMEVTKHKYNDDDNIINVTNYNKDGKINYETKWTYDGDHVKSVTTTNYWDDTPITHEQQFIYDGRTIVEEHIFRNGTLICVNKFTNYDKDGAKWVSHNADGTEQINGYYTLNKARKYTQYACDDIQFQIKWDENNSPIETKNAEVDQNGATYYYKEGANLFFEYEYDNKGNWIKQIVFEGDMRTPLTISERKIVY